MPNVNPVSIFGQVPSSNPTYGHILAGKLGKWEFQLYPQLWYDSQLAVVNSISWTRVKFGHNTLDQVPEGSGVYFFAVEGRVDLIDVHHYLFYAGKAETGLRSRYSDYLEEREGRCPEEDRNKVTEFLAYFQENVYFYFSELPREQTAAVESAIKDNLTPPANTILKIKGRLV